MSMPVNAKLLLHNPGIITSFEISLNKNDGNFGEISFKSVLSNLVTKSKKDIKDTTNILSSSSSSTSSSSTLLSSASSSSSSSRGAAELPTAPPVFQTKPNRCSIYDNIINRIERKASSNILGYHGDDNSENSRDNYDHAHHKQDDETGDNNDAEEAKKKKRKSRESQLDDYDREGKK